jgi:type I restriction enzyme, S subunit
MSCNWPRVQISDVCELIVDCVNKTAPRVEDETPYKMIRTPNIKGGKISRNDCRFVTEDTYEKWTRRAKVLRDDVLLTREAPMGEVGIVDFDDTVFLGQRIMQYRADKSKIDPHFLLYSFLSNNLQHQFHMHEGSGSVVSHIRVPDCSKFELNLPPLSLQKQISGVLKHIDRKISLNSETNQTLEQMAQAIFKSWFVDFDPVKAKMNGEQPEGMDAATASLFPEKLVESELGLIPEGWIASSMGEHFNITMGQSPKGETYNEEGEGIAFFQGRRDFGFRYPDVRVYTTDPKRFAKAGDTLISVRAPVGDKNMAAIDCCIGRGVAAIKHKSQSRSFTYAFVSHIEKKLGDSGSSGTVFSSINQNELKKVSFVAPPQELVEAFHKLVDPIDQKIEVLSEEIKSLSALRDTLLPKLLSGEIELGSVATE